MKENVDLTVFSPTAPLGIFIIICGLIFSSIVFYIIYAVSTNKESLEDKKMRVINGTNKDYKNRYN